MRAVTGQAPKGRLSNRLANRWYALSQQV
jgi:hypothetical protein